MKGKTRFALLLAGLCVVALGIAAVLAVLVFDWRPDTGAYTAEGPVKALWVPMVTGDGTLSTVTADMTEDEAAAALQTVVDRAVSAGANTLLFEVQSAGSTGVYYTDKKFAPVNTQADPLALLCTLAQKAGVQVIAVVQPFAAGPAGTPAQKGTAAADFYSENTVYDNARWFNPLNVRAMDTLASAYARLLGHYPVAGVVFSNLSFGAESADVQAALVSFGDKMKSHAHHKSIGLSFDSKDSLLSTAQVTALCQNGFDLLLPAGSDVTAFALWQAAAPEGAAVLPTPGNTTTRSDFAALLRTLSLQGTLAGAVLGNPTEVAETPALTGLMVSYFDTPIAVSAPQTTPKLTTGYPADGSSVTSETVVVLGTSDPALPLTLNGTEVPGRAAGGSFAIEVPLEVGKNQLTFAQPGGESLSTTVIRKDTTTTTPATPAPTPNTKLDTALAGRTVQVTKQLASALTDAGSDDAIAMSLKQGAKIAIRGTVETLRSGSIVPAYQLASGDYLLADNAELLGEDATAAVTLAAPAASTDARGDVTLQLPGGTPVVYDSLRGDELKLKFYGTTLGFDPALLVNDFVSEATAEPLDEEADGAAGTLVTLTLRPGSGFWGYDVYYDGDNTVLYFQKAPQASTVPGKPLTGVRVLLDAGHGGTDNGAAGIGAGTGTTEKTVNLALTLAVKERLEQLGATVLMTRTDDTFPTLQDRWAMQQQDRPDFFIALHHNSTGLTKDTSEAKGLEVYYFDRVSASFAQNLMDSVAAATGRATDTPKWNYFYVTRITSAPSVLFEFGYLVNPQEYEDCTSEAGIRAAAEGVAEGILRTLPATP